MNKKKLSRSGSLQSSVTSVLAALLCILIGFPVQRSKSRRFHYGDNLYRLNRRFRKQLFEGFESLLIHPIARKCLAVQILYGQQFPLDKLVLPVHLCNKGNFCKNGCLESGIEWGNGDSEAEFPT